MALDSSIRSYISAHKSEFYDGAEGDDEEAHQSVDDDLDVHDDPSNSAGADSIDGKVKPKEPLAFISDTVPMSKPLCDFVSTLWDTLADVVGQTSPSTLICSFIIFVLFVSNIFTLSSLRHSSSRYVPQRRPPPEYNPNLPLAEEAEGHDVVAAAVRGVLHEYFQHSHKPRHTKLADDLEQRDLPGNEEAQEILTMIELLEKRVQALKSSLQDLD